MREREREDHYQTNNQKKKTRDENEKTTDIVRTGEDSVRTGLRQRIESTRRKD